MANQVPNRAASAAPRGQKISTCSQECIRRMKNTSRELNHKDIEGVLMRYMDELISGGYIEDFRFRILKAATTEFVKMWEQERLGKTMINRPDLTTRKARRTKNKVTGLWTYRDYL